MKFQSSYDQTIDGFWDSESPLKGILVDYTKGSIPFYVIEIVEENEATLLRVQDESQKDDAGNPVVTEEHGVAPGMRIGVRDAVAFKGLEKYIGHTVTFTFTGWKPLSRGRQKREYDIDLSDKPVRPKTGNRPFNGRPQQPRG